MQDPETSYMQPRGRGGVASSAEIQNTIQIQGSLHSSDCPNWVHAASKAQNTMPYSSEDGLGFDALRLTMPHPPHLDKVKSMILLQAQIYSIP